MSYFAVIREAGRGWEPARPLREQPAWGEHAVFMDALAAEGFVVLGGPLSGGGRALLVVNAPSESEVRRRLDDDPWTSMEVLAIASIEPWDILLGPELLAAAGRTPEAWQSSR